MSDEIRARIQEELYDMLDRRAVVWFVSARRCRVLVTGLSSFWGGRLAQTLEKDPADRDDHRRLARRPDLELERTEFVRVGTQHALLRRIVRPRRSTR